MSANASAAVGLRAGPREWLGLAVLALPTLLLSLDVTVLFLAVPHISADLAPSSTQALWIMDIYGFMVAGFLITMGTLGDRIGRRKLLLTGALAFGVASALAAYSTSAEMLIVTRALLGLAGATLMPATLALITNMFRDPKQLGMAIGAWASCFSVGIAIGPLVGGVMLESFWWGSVFLLGVPVMLLLVVLGPILLPEHKDPDAGRMDLASVALSLLAMLPLVYGIKEVAKGEHMAASVVALVVGLAFAVVFVRRQRQLENPLLDMRLFANRSFAVALGVLLLGLVAIGGIYLFVTQYLQLVEGLSPLKSGMWLLPAAIGMVITSTVAPAIAQRIRPGFVVGGALLVSATGYLLLAFVAPDTGLWLVVVGFAVLYLGTGPVMALGTNLVVASAPPEKAGSASAMSETSMELGVSLGIAALGSLGATVYASQVDVPEGLPGNVVSATEDSLASASAVVTDVPSEVGASVLSAAREAFLSGMSVIAAVSAGIVLLLAVMAMVALRHVPSAGAEDDASQEEAPEDAAADAAADEAAGTPLSRQGHQTETAQVS
ncbi:MFS transporter [Streptomyces apocyni]|uniref:MFS transporter n=1 Tax=Streptomyces apocyni TaxID=2654677 RepID=UPI0012EABE99|nr:MFS transporter [Streptomyces apocyni]